MLSKLRSTLRQYGMLSAGDTVICAVSGGADSMALLWAMYLLRDEMPLCVEAAHFNHHLRGEESNRDQAFVERFCAQYSIPLHLGEAQVRAGKKGLEAAAREARYEFFHSLCGKVATAHTADDNAETVLLHLIRGTGLKGLGAITPVSGQLIRPLLNVTRQEVEAFLEEYSIDHIEDSSNGSDQFLRNRVRQGIMPLLRAENPKIAENLSAMAQRLRLDELALGALAEAEMGASVSRLRSLPEAVRARVLERFLKASGVREPEALHIRACEALVFSENPSACADFPGGITVCRQYDALTVRKEAISLPERVLPCPGSLFLPEAGLTVRCEQALGNDNTAFSFTVRPRGAVKVRSRQAGDRLRLPGGTKTVKKKWIDDKIPAARRSIIPVVADDLGVLGVCGLGGNLDRLAGEQPGLRIWFESASGTLPESDR